LAAPTNTERLNTLEQSVATFDERIDNLRERVTTIVKRSGATQRIVQDLDKQCAVLIGRVERLEGKLDESQMKRWDLWKLILAAIFGFLLNSAVTLINRALDRPPGVVPAEHEPAAIRPN
jgi:hypothetical protein